MTDHDPAREFLARRGCAEHVVARGLQGLLHAWARVVDEIARGYRFGLDDYCNDMDGRQLLAEALQAVDELAARPVAATLAGLDARAKGLLAPPGACVWGDELARQNGWSPDANWWYFRTPLHPGGELAEDLASWGGD